MSFFKNILLFLKQFHSVGVDQGTRMYILIRLWTEERHESRSQQHYCFFLPPNLHSLSIILLWPEKIWHFDCWILDGSCLLGIWPFWNYFPEDTSLQKNFFLFFYLAWNSQEAFPIGIFKHDGVSQLIAQKELCSCSQSHWCDCPHSAQGTTPAVL